MKKVGILMGSDSDLPIVKKAIDTLEALAIPYEVHVYSAHRTPVEAAQFAKNAKKWKHEDGGILHAQTGASVNLKYFKNTKKSLEK